MTVFNMREIESELNLAMDRFDEWKSGLEHPTNEQIKSLRERDNFMLRCKEMARLVDYGKPKTGEGTLTVWDSVEPLLNDPSGAEVQFVAFGRPDDHYHHDQGLVMIHEGEHGIAAVLQTFGSKKRFSAALGFRAERNASQDLLTYYCVQQKLGLSRMTFRGAPVYVPPEIMHRRGFGSNLSLLVREYIRKHVPTTSEGLVQWNASGAENIYGLAAKNWWFDVADKDLAESILAPRHDSAH